jgi:RNA polymerase sigma-70 factor (ECF subfamily)
MDGSRRSYIQEAMVRLADGDRSAFPILLDQLWPVILSFARRGVGHEQDAEDVAQEVFLRICSRISDFDRTRDGLAWAFGIAGYEVMSHRRRNQRRREAFVEAELPDPAASQEEVVIEQEMTAALARAVGALSSEDRLTLAGGRSAELAGPVLRKRRQRALDRLRAVWRRLHGEP